MSAQDLSRWERLWTGPLWAKFAVCIAIGLVIGLILGTLVDKASAREPAEVSASVGQRAAPARQCDPTADAPCPTEARWHAKKFRHGKVNAWKHGIPVKRFYVRPAAVKKVWVRKIGRLLHHRAQARGIAAPGHSYRPAAIERYEQLVRAGTCATYMDLYPAWDTDHELCMRMPGISDSDHPKEEWMTAGEVKAFGAAALCTGGTIATVVAVPATAGASAYVAVGFGGASCMYGLWASLS
jgi:hypothetical protein